MSELRDDDDIPYIKSEFYSGMSLSLNIPLMVVCLQIQFSTAILNGGMLEDYLDQNLLIPLVRETTSMIYTSAAMSESLGDLQNRIRVKNLIENYIVILLFVLGSIAAISLTNSNKFILKKSQILRHSTIEDYQMEYIELSEDLNSIIENSEKVIESGQ